MKTKGNKQLLQELTELRSWKAETLEVEARCDMQAVGKALDLPLGCKIRENILPSILAIKEELAREKTEKFRLMKMLNDRYDSEQRRLEDVRRSALSKLSFAEKQALDLL